MARTLAAGRGRPQAPFWRAPLRRRRLDGASARSTTGADGAAPSRRATRSGSAVRRARCDATR